MSEYGSTAAGAQRASDVVSAACVVVIDDQPANVRLLEEMLRSIGIGDIHTVTESRHAVTRCHEVGADLVVLDLHMPGVDGHEVLRELQETVADDDYLPVLVVTADTTTDARDRALQAGAKDFLTKPVDYTEVVLRVRNLLETRAMHRSLASQNAVLRAELTAQAERERCAIAERQRREERIEAALAPGNLQMAFQPIADLHSYTVVGAEALARFQCAPVRPPNVWFSEAAAVGRDAELELAAVRAAVAHIGELPSEVFLSVNVSPATALLPALVEALAPVDPRRLVLELTEHAPVDDYPVLLQALAPLQAQGLRIAVDDTGMGYAGLGHLLQLRPDIIKLDLDLTRGIDGDPARRALATALVAFATETDATIIAEGVETAAELDTLRTLGIRWGQGYHLGRPAPLPLAVTAGADTTLEAGPA